MSFNSDEIDFSSFDYSLRFFREVNFLNEKPPTVLSEDLTGKKMVCACC